MSSEKSEAKEKIESRFAAEDLRSMQDQLDRIEQGIAEREDDGDQASRSEAPTTLRGRAQAESDRGGYIRSAGAATRFGRASEHSQRVIDAIVAEKQDWRSSVDLGIIDLATTVENIFKYASKVGRKGLADRIQNLIKWALVVSGAIIIGVAVLQPGTLEIFANALNTPRNLFIFVGLVVLVAVLYIWTLVSQRRSKAKAPGVVA